MEHADIPTTPLADAEDDVVTIPEEAFLIIDGVKVFPLSESVVNIGRRLDNHLVIDDVRVSRCHAQLRAINSRYVIFDLNSSGGTFINGRKMTQAVLYPGDVITQKNPPPRPDLKPTWPL
jgi:pSer/pThr/pTyr-binding forkhead associated (FHA) protein